MPTFIDEQINYFYDCDMINETDFNQLFNENAFDRDNFGIFHLNIRSINSNFNLLETHLSQLQFKFSIIVLTETWLTQCKLDTFHLAGYQTFDLPSVGRRGGIRIYVVDNLNAQTIVISHGNTFQSLNLKICFANRPNISLCAIYRSPNISRALFNIEFENAFNELFRPNDNVIFVGDFNLDLFRCEETQIGNFYDFMRSLGLVPLITLPTRAPPDSNCRSLIDQIWTNISPPVKSYVFDTIITDHFPVASIFQFITSKKIISIKFRDFSRKNLTKFFAEVQNIPDNLQNICVDNLHNAHYELAQELEIILNKYFPIRVKNVGTRKINSPWLTPSILLCIKKKHMLFKLFKQGQIQKSYFNIYKNKLKHLLVIAKKEYFNARFLHAKNNIKKTWSIINKSLNRVKHNKIMKLSVNNNTITDKKLICDELNSYFVSAVNDLQNNMSNTYSSNCMLNNVKVCPRSFALFDTDEAEIYRIINSLKNNNNLTMPTKFLKLFSPVISTLIATFANRCFSDGVYPDALKRANITPILKSGDPSKPTNYRPISVLSDLNKIYEELILNRLNNLLTKNNILENSQYGFRQGVSTQGACLDLLSVLLKAYSDKTYAICLFVDFRKAFDTLNHKRLLKKLEMYGIRGKPLELIESYLTNRLQRVCLNGASSDYVPMSMGVPHSQGSKLGPLLFNLYVNDLCTSLRNNSTFQYADDTALAAV